PGGQRPRRLSRHAHHPAAGHPCRRHGPWPGPCGRQPGDDPRPAPHRTGGGRVSADATTVPGADRAEAWALGAPRPSYRLRGVRAVLAERIVENATITVEDGRIEDVTTGASAGPGDRPVIDGQNLLLLPGFVDVHSDALETE